MQDSSYLILAKGNKIKKVFLVKNFEDALIKAQDQKLRSFLAIFFNCRSPDLVPLVGNYVPNIGNSESAVVIRPPKQKDLPYSKNSVDKDDDNKKFNLLNQYYIGLDLTKLDLIKSEIEKNNPDLDDELYYRCLYHSFKMYYVRDSSIELAKLLLRLIGVNPKENYYEIVDQLKDNQFSDILIKMLERSIASSWSRDRNHVDRWVEDAQVLFSINILLYKSAKFLLDFSYDIVNKKGILFDETRSLSWMQAGSMEVWEPLAGIRYGNEFAKRFKQILINP